ncbi:hypothetical protein [Pseudomonas sp. S1Bt23]|uniref:hypothetical protein n=1 Tax=Pseudomonas sp. S1Bt23 TaxID=3095074 RepID=UPI002A5A6475|nr:hypothetical protein [Pseudomonas sp. S1Bt23]WPO46646.1 hypothetical protein SHB59_25830 [Pseudomonas sp. S1Bt23]
MKNLKGYIIVVLCFGISLTERFTQASIPLIVNHMGLTSIEMSLFLSTMAASTVFTGLLIAPYIDSYKQKGFSGIIILFASAATLSFYMFGITQALGWGCFLMFCIGVILRIINFRRLSVINSEVSHAELSRAHTRMQLSITIAMAAAPICLTLTKANNYLNFALTMLLICVVFSLCSSSVSATAKAPGTATVARSESREIASANHFIFIGMLLSGLFLSALFLYCQSVSDKPVQLYANIIFFQVVGLITANIMFERFFGERFRQYGVLIIAIAISEIAFIFTQSSILINALASLIGFSFQIMFLRSHNQFQRNIPRDLTAKFNGIRGLYTFAGITTGYILGPILYNLGGTGLVFATCSTTALLFFLSLKHLSPIPA